MAKRSFISLELADFLSNYLEFTEETRSGNTKINDQENDEKCNEKNQSEKEKEDELCVKSLDLLLLKTNRNNLDDAQINEIPVNINDFEGTHEDADNDNDSVIKDNGSDIKHDDSELRDDGSELKDDDSELKGDDSELKDDYSELKGDYSDLSDDVFYNDQIIKTKIQNKVVSKEQEDSNQKSYEERRENFEARKKNEEEKNKKHNEKMGNYDNQGFERKTAENTERMIYPKRKSFVYSSFNIIDTGRYSDNEGNFNNDKCSNLKGL